MTGKLKRDAGSPKSIDERDDLSARHAECITHAMGVERSGDDVGNSLHYEVFQFFNYSVEGIVRYDLRMGKCGKPAQSGGR